MLVIYCVTAHTHLQFLPKGDVISWSNLWSGKECFLVGLTRKEKLYTFQTYCTYN